MTPEWYVIVLLCMVAVAAGWVDAVSGGGGLLQLPALLLVAPVERPAVALGTNKLSSIMGTTAAAVTYGRSQLPKLWTALPMALAAFAGAGFGARVATGLPASVFRPLILVALVAVWLFVALRPSLGSETREVSAARRWTTAIVGGLVIGLYDGMLGPGTGAFLVILLVAATGLNFLQASATAKIVNIGTNMAALLVFGYAGAVAWGIGLAMGACNVLGAIIGARTAIARGSGFVRGVLLVVVALLIAALAWQTLATLG
jgi:uncharacterized protein